MQYTGDKSAYAYAWSLAHVEMIVQQNGMGDMERLLDRIAAGESAEGALRNVLHSDYEELEQFTADYLRKNYVR